MIAVDQAHADANRVRVMWVGVVLAMITVLAYMLIGWNILAVGDLQVAERPAGIVYVAAACYLVGGFLILVGNRWLWVAGAVMNALVLLFFFQTYIDRPTVLLSVGGLVTKTAQLLLEICLLYLIVTAWHRPHPQAR